MNMANRSQDEKNQYTCPDCQAVFIHKSSFSRHKRSKCGEEKTFSCICGKEFGRLDSLKRHIQVCKGKEKKPTKCEKCFIECQTNWHLKRHMKSCINKCKDCKKVVTDSESHRCVAVLKVSLFKEKPKSNNKNSHVAENVEVPNGFSDLCYFAMLLMNRDKVWSYYDDPEVDFVPAIAPFNQVAEDPISPCDVPIVPVIPFNQVAEDPIPPCDIDDQIVPQFSSVLSPRSSKRKSNNQNHQCQRVATDIANLIKSQCESKNISEKDVLRLVIKRLNLTDHFQPCHTPSDRGFSLEIRSKIWSFWHENSQESTNTTAIVSIRTEDKPPSHKGLKYVDTVKSVVKRSSMFFQSIWMTTVQTYRELYNKFCSENPDSKVSFGYFVEMKPFYIRHATKKDLVMCCCKTHLHVRWVIEALIRCLKKQGIEFPVSNYETFFQYLYSNCQHDEHSYISFDCTPNKKVVCQDILDNWKEIQDSISDFDDETTVSFTEFQKLPSFAANGTPILDKKGVPLKRLTVVKHQVNVSYLVKFLGDLIPEIIFHRNMLKLYRNTIKEFNMLFPSVHLDIDFSENLTLDVKYEPQSLHWIKKQVSVHSGILKCQGLKQYHPYISDDKIHDQSFVRHVIIKMLDSIIIPDDNIIIIESDNCSSQYKSAEHFYNLQFIADKYNKTVVAVYGVAGHGKGEVDHVGGVVKVAVRQEVARGESFTNASETVNFLQEKFSKSESSFYNIMEIKSENLEEIRKESSRKIYRTIHGSSEFHLILFEPGCTSFKASNRYCICSLCQLNIGSCSLFKQYELQVENIIPSSLRSEKLTPVDQQIDLEADDYILESSIVAVSPAKNSDDAVWFIKVSEVKCCSTKAITDDYGHTIPPCVEFLKGNFMERISFLKAATLFKCSKKLTYFYKETILYPFVEMNETKKGFLLKNEDYTDILMHIENTGYAHL